MDADTRHVVQTLPDEHAPKVEPELVAPVNLAEMQIQVREVDPAEQQCLAEAMYHEARGEGKEGMYAVAAVIVNRVEDKRFPNSVCDVIYEGGETPPCQFSWWCDGRSDRPTDQLMWSHIRELAHNFLALRPEDPTDLTREGGVMFRTEGGIEPVPDGRILQGYLENSNVEAITQFARMIEVQRAYELGQSFLDAENERVRDALRTFTRP